jgi:hypothetical protein
MVYSSPKPILLNGTFCICCYSIDTLYIKPNLPNIVFCSSCFCNFNRSDIETG